MIARPDIVTRWAVSDGPLSIATTGSSATATCKSVSVEAAVADGLATINVADVTKLMPSCGVSEVTWACGLETVITSIEHVGGRYCKRVDIEKYGAKRGDAFDDKSRYTDADVSDAIQQAEEAIDRGCGRSFCARGVDVRLSAGRLVELPVQDARTISSGSLVSDRQAVSDDGCMATVMYGSYADARIREAAVRLAASILRATVGSENARGQSVDGVYTSYTLATGADGSWTGIPYVDAVIEEHRSHRVIVG